ncbi:MAG: IscS subfamily cysteine desulfurase [Labilithrix sp.]|nr:IscS subfamily cysteine desulfurase [Labilithrix sp.]
MAVKLPIFMDYHSTTPVDPRVLEEMLPYFTEKFGNAASRSHAFGWSAEEAVDYARERIAKLIGASSEKEIVFTSGASESNNLAIKGVAEFYQDKGNHIITSVIEHKAVLDTCKRLEKEGFSVTYLPVNKEGLVEPSAVEQAITDKTILVSIMLANNEIGTVQPLEAIGKITRAKNILFHTDAVQGVGKVDFDVQKMNVDLASITAHKMYGPKGVGALFVRRSKPRVRIVAQMDGGGHERGMRSGTLNVPAIVGFGKAAEILTKEGKEEAARLLSLRERLRKKLQGALEETYVNGSLEHRLPGNLNISFNFVEGEAMMMAIKDVAVSSGSACTSASLEPSYVLRALGVGDELAHSSIRFGLGRFSTEAEVDFVADLVIQKVKHLREMSPLYEMHKEGIDLKSVAWVAH